MSINDIQNSQTFNDTDEISLKELIIKIKEWIASGKAVYGGWWSI